MPMREVTMIMQAITVVTSLLAALFWFHSAMMPFPNPLRRPPFRALAHRWPRYGTLVANQEGSNALGASFAAVAALTQAIVFLITFPLPVA
jgi:hypothetical protein